MGAARGQQDNEIQQQSGVFPVTNIDGTLHTIYMQYTYIDKYFEMKLN